MLLIPGPASDPDHFPTAFSVIGSTVASDMVSQQPCTIINLGVGDLTEKDNSLPIRAAAPTAVVTKVRYSRINVSIKYCGNKGTTRSS